MFYFYRKNSLSFLGVAIGKFVEINVKSSIDSYFNKGTTLTKEGVNNQSSRPENIISCSTINDTAGSDCITSCSKNLQSDLKNSALLPNKLPSLLHHINSKKTDDGASNSKNIKTMFSEMKSTNESYNNSTTSVQNVVTKKENEKKITMNSFFSKKLKIISPVKNQDDDKQTMKMNLSSPVSPVSFSSKKLEIISPLKNESNDTIEVVTQQSDSFFQKKLEIVSPSKRETIDDSHQASIIQLPIIEENNDSQHVSIIQLPIIEENNEDIPSKLLCERCKQMIDIDQYDEHFDHHVALELSTSLNSVNMIKSPIKNKIHLNGSSKKKKNESGNKRKHKSNNSSSNSKKQCTVISSYFKPVLDP